MRKTTRNTLSIAFKNLAGLSNNFILVFISGIYLTPIPQEKVVAALYTVISYIAAVAFD